jgi:lipid-A-disaccharide synthase-like uncharacterized protein
MLESFRIDGWTLWGFMAQGIFFASFVVQWYKSEKQKSSILPIEFWLMRLLASAMMILYVWYRRDIVFLISTILQIVIYVRNISFYKK